MSTAKQKTSSIWSYYSEECETLFVRCNKFSSKIKRGKYGDRKIWPSNPLWSHLKTRHAADHRKTMEDRDKADQVTKERKLDEAERQAVYVNRAPKLAAFVEKKESTNHSFYYTINIMNLLYYYEILTNLLLAYQSYDFYLVENGTKIG